MENVLIWGTGIAYLKLVNIIRVHEKNGDFKVVGITSDEYFYSSVDGYRFIRKEDLYKESFEYILVTNKNYQEVFKEIANRRIRCSVIRADVLLHPDFDWKRYLKIKKRVPSIISRNCWGGILYNAMGLEFTSPTINMW